jgi:uncharacterized protein YndB with AHSA1/START domain
MTQKKPERTLELHVDIDAPIEAAWKAITEGPGIANWFAPIAEVSAPGEGATVKAGWSEEMMMTHTVVAWEPLKHVRWLDESGWMGPGTSMALDYYLSTENGKTRVRLVQSAFGASEGWDDLFDGTETGWTYFLQNLRIYIEKHLGRVRRLITERIQVDMPRQKFWRHLLSGAAGFVIGGTGAVKAGDWIELKLNDRARGGGGADRGPGAGPAHRRAHRRPALRRAGGQGRQVPRRLLVLGVRRGPGEGARDACEARLPAHPRVPPQIAVTIWVRKPIL